MTAGIADRVALVTGASTGIGLATAAMLRREGAQVMLAARSADRLAAAARDLGPEVDIVPTDVGDRAAIDRMIAATLDRFGRLDVVVANAGVYLGGDLVDSDPAGISRLIATNIDGVIQTVHASLPHLLEHGTGDIIVTSSVSGHQAIHWEPVYSASKHALQAFVHGVRRQLQGSGVRIGAVAPGIVLNELWQVTAEEAVDDAVARGDGMRSEDVAEAIAFMLSRPRHVTIRDLVMLPREQPI
ncbi:MAG: SDR family oxidoreductase [Nitriliruptoraceae bacterium]